MGVTFQTARALSSPSREAAEDKIEERENVFGRRNYGLRVTEGQTDVEFEIVFLILENARCAGTV